MSIRILQIQTVLYYNEPSKIIRSIESLIQAVQKLKNKMAFDRVILAYGDGTPTPVFTEKERLLIKEKYKEDIDIQYIEFGSNLGSARGHNVLAKDSIAEYIVVMNPDIIMTVDTLCELYEPYKNGNDKVGMVEARQLPIEHPKYYDIKTGETSWASTACTMFPKKVYDAVGGFDADTFFLYCDDVDFSWMVRLAGYKIIFQPSAVVFHDKTLSKQAQWESSNAEDYYSAEAGLLLAYKWSREDLVENILRYFESAEEKYYQKAAIVFKERKVSGKLPKQLDKHHRIAEFKENNYGTMRFSL